MSTNIRLRISDKDRELLELIAASNDVTLSAAARAAIRATAVQLGLVKATPQDLMKKK
jgi:hypothetical protein